MDNFQNYDSYVNTPYSQTYEFHSFPTILTKIQYSLLIAMWARWESYWDSV
jgi:hypothetical protein